MYLFFQNLLIILATEQICFLDAVESTPTRNSDNPILPNALRFGFRAASWGHTNFPNPNYDELRHIVSSFLMSYRNGPTLTRDITMGNEMLGLILDTETPGPGTAFELRDVINNEKGINSFIEKVF